MRDIAIIAVAQMPNVPREEVRNEVEMLMPVLARGAATAGLTPQEIGFTCSGSTDYLSGQAFSFVSTLDGVGPWPPIQESHVEMDGAWALYEAWVKLQLGELDTALVYCYGKSSPGPLHEVLSRQLDPYSVGPLWPDPISLAALQARALLESGKATEADFAEVASRSRRNALANPNAQPGGTATAADLLAEEPLVDPLRKSDCPPITDGACAMILAADDTARRLRERPAWIRGIDHRIEPMALGLRDLRRSASTARRPSRRAGAGRRSTWPSSTPRSPHQELLLPGGPGPRRTTPTSTCRAGRSAANPVMVAGLTRIGEVAQRIMDGTATRGLAHCHLGPVPAAEPRRRPGRGVARWRKERVAVIGVGQTKHQATRGDVSMAGLVRRRRPAPYRRRRDDLERHRRRGRGQGPDFFEGVMMPELYPGRRASARPGKPLFRVHTAGSVGGSTAIVASQLVAGRHPRAGA